MFIHLSSKTKLAKGLEKLFYLDNSDRPFGRPSKISFYGKVLIERENVLFLFKMFDMTMFPTGLKFERKQTSSENLEEVDITK